MSDSHRNAAPRQPGHSGHQRLSATGIAEALEAYSTQGGQLLGARRWTQNPLTLTHVRWMGQRGGQLDAVRAPEHDATLDDVELRVWVELAVHFPAMHPSAINSEATWLTLNISPQQAAGLAVRLARALASSHYSDYGSGNPSAPSSSGTPPFAAPGSPGSYGGYSPSPMAHSPMPASHPSAGPTPRPAAPGSWPRSAPASGGDPWGGNPNGNPGQFARGPIFDDGVSVIPSVEIELPGVVMAGVTSASVREFARDAAATFVRALKSVPQARELRGWMRGGRMVLAARLIMAPGAGVATPQESEDAMRMLARAMAMHTLPFARVGIADPGEWSQAQTLTEM